MIALEFQPIDRGSDLFTQHKHPALQDFHHAETRVQLPDHNTTSFRHSMPEPGSLTDLLARKEKELHNIYGTLEQTLKDKEKEVCTALSSTVYVVPMSNHLTTTLFLTHRLIQCQELRARFKSLQDDFVYNLQLLEERDKELERYDVTTEELKNDVAERCMSASIFAVGTDRELKH